MALTNYRQAAVASNDPRIAERAAMLALIMKDDAAALDLARRWQVLDPSSEQPQQALALALLRNGRETRPWPRWTRSAGPPRAKDKQQGFATVASLLSQMDDKQAALRVMRRLRDRYPREAYAQYYHAMLAAAAGDQEQGASQFEGGTDRNPKLFPPTCCVPASYWIR
ncbi:MAG: hypothetical protein R3F44_14730 [Candidatus Competibacteraceae bacterium]